MYEADALRLIYDVICFTVMFGLLPCLEMYDRVSHARVSHMCSALYCFKDGYMFWDE